ncbi:kelch repeat-containing protein [Chryseolinea lacunae]|uniref:T9SS type A sorting domain-containing protein n=1 Tax=Chryseolinea lacunae TaxID=2801331 RepID=A0ABS1KZG9_9BACT|nr:T9SS type A sorting domain-containing protein [Chryseolinea lacunae]MBL0743706.1 T9SS type A sorting domain-containing protein [Chryseolinea lacunae]
MKTILRKMRWLTLGVWLFAGQHVAAQNGLWTLKAGPALGPELSGATIHIGTNYFVVSSGVIWLFDGITSTWHIKSPPGSGTIGFAFTIGNKVYVSRLESYDPQSPNDSRAFWEYDAALDSWTRKGGFKCSGVDGQVSFVWNGKGYVGTGRAGGTRTYSNDFWMYDPVANTWTEVASIPGVPRTHGVSFIIGDKAYVGAGAAADFTPPYPNQTPPSDSLLRSFYEYDLINNSWRSIKSLPAGMYRGTGFSIGNTGFVGLGDQYNTSGLKNATVYAYDPGANRWTEKNKAPVSLPWLVTLWTSNNKAYVRSGNGAYEFDPQFTPPVTWTGTVDNAWSNPANWSPQRVPTANDAVIIQPTAYPHYVALDQSTQVGSLTIQNGASLKVKNGATLTSPGGITNNGFLCGATGAVNGTITGTPRQDYLIPQALLSLDSDTTYENGMRSTLFFADKVNTGGRNEVDYEFWVNDERIQGNDSKVFFTNNIHDRDVVYSVLKVTGPDCVAERSAPSLPITVRATQYVNFSLQQEAYLGDAPIALGLDGALPGRAPVFGSDNPAIASVAGSTLTLHAEGQVQIWAFRPGNKFFAKTDTVRQTLTVLDAAHTLHWSGFDNVWENAANWTPHRLPTATDNLVFPGGNVTFVEASHTVKNAYLFNSASLKLRPGTTLTVTGAIYNEGFVCLDNSQVVGTLVHRGATQTITPVVTLQRVADEITLRGRETYFGISSDYSGRNIVDFDIKLNGVLIAGGDIHGASVMNAAPADVLSGAMYAHGVECVAEGPTAANTVLAGPLPPKFQPTLTFDPLADHNTSEGWFVLTGRLDTGLPVVYGSSNPVVATVSHDTVWLKAAGIAQISASYGGSDYFLPVAPVIQTLTVTSDASFAGVVKKFTAGKTKNGKAIDPLRADASKALGAPQENDTYNFVSLGFGGTITLELEQQLYDDGTYKPDFILVETSFGRADEKCYSDAGVFNYPESAVVQVSPDGTQWRSLPDSYCRTSFIDISSVIDAGFPYVKFIRVKDFTNKELFDNAADGFDLDGIIVGSAAVEEAFTRFTNGRAEQTANVWDASFFNRLPNEPEELGATSTLYPNPAQGGNIAIDYASPIDQTVRVALVSATGSPVRERGVAVTSGKNTIVENIDGLSKGVYLVRIVSSGALVVHRFVRL